MLSAIPHPLSSQSNKDGLRCGRGKNIHPPGFGDQRQRQRKQRGENHRGGQSRGRLFQEIEDQDRGGGEQRGEDGADGVGGGDELGVFVVPEAEPVFAGGGILLLYMVLVAVWPDLE